MSNYKKSSETEVFIKPIDKIVIDGYKAVVEIWCYEGISASSLVFNTSIVKLLNDEQLIQLTKKSGLPIKDSKFSINRNNKDQVVVSFNFIDYGDDVFER